MCKHNAPIFDLGLVFFFDPVVKFPRTEVFVKDLSDSLGIPDHLY